MATT
ncbi:Protein of unknown function [Bacillus cereus]|jgi:hypothetical protein